jgi:hypothetical protein
MGVLWGLFGCFTPLLLLALFGVAYVYIPGAGVPSVDELVAAARKYRRKRPGAKEDELRGALVDRFAPPLDDDSPLGSGAVLGLGGMAGARFGRWLKRLRHDQAKTVVAGRVEQALAKLADKP